MSLGDLRRFGVGRFLTEKNIAPLAVVVGSLLIGLSFWLLGWRSLRSLHDAAPYGGIALLSILLGGALTWYLRILLVRLGGAGVQTQAGEMKMHHLLADLSNLAVHGYNQDRQIVFWNEGSERLYGYRQEEALGRTLEELLFPPSMHSSVIRTVSRWFAERRPIPCSELDLLRKDGSLVAVSSSRVILPAGRDGWRLYSLDIDLSDQKQAQIALARHEALLEMAVLIAARLLKTTDPLVAVTACFPQLGEAVGVDRISLFENRLCPQTGFVVMHQRYVWRTEQAPRTKSALQNLSYEQDGFERWRQALAANDPILGLVREFPDSERAILEIEGVVASLVVAINVHGEFWGFIGYDDCRHERRWTPAERSILQHIAANVGEAIARCRAERALQDSEERFRRLADNMRDLVCEIDANGTILYLSPSYRALGFETEALLGRSIFSNVHMEDRQMTIAACKAAKLQGQSGQAQFRYRRADGEYLWLEAVGNPLFDASGKISGAVISSRDITERHRAAAELHLAARVFENSREAIMISDADNRILSVNKAFVDITGYTPNEVIGQTPQLLASDRHDHQFFQTLWNAVTTEGHWQGEIWNQRKNGEVYPEWLSVTAVYDARGNLTHYLGIFSDLSERKATADQIEFLAHHDALTALPNRILFYDRLEQALIQAERQRGFVAVLMLDLDRFKLINDSLGHELGDQLLQLVAVRLRQQMRETDTVSRQASDEFLLLLPETGLEGADRVAGSLLKCIQNEPFRIAEHTLSLTASIGVTLYPTHGRNSDSLLRQAGVALDYAKNGGGNTYRFFVSSMNANRIERLYLESSLRLALNRGEFLLYYQPQFSIADGLIVGAEALLRWQHPEWGLVAPGRFIPVAEDSGLIVPIGEWVLQEACRQAKAWQHAGLRPVTVAVNLSAIQFKRTDLLATVIHALTESGLAPDYLELELTESILIQDVDAALKVVQKMRAMGLKLSIDDFGTGYSSLSYLQKLAVHKLKIDQSFIRNVTGSDTDSAAIVRAIIQMAHSLKLLTVAEGVETGQQLSFLRHHRCDEMQGYYLGRPLPAAEFATWLAEPAQLALA